MSSSLPPSGPHAASALDSDILRLLMDTSPDRIYFKDLQSRIVRNNLAHAVSVGAKRPEDCVGKTDFDLFSRQHAEKALADEQQIIRTRQPIIGLVERPTTRDGRKTWVSTTKMPWLGPDGTVLGTWGVTRDITETKEAEERLQHERNLLRTIIDNLPSRLYVKDLAAQYILNNRAHLEALGVHQQTDAAGRTTADFFPGERGDQAFADDQVVLAGGHILNQEKSDFALDGNVRWSLVTKVPLRDGTGDVIGLVGISHDITRRKLAEQELQRRSSEMEADLRMAYQVQEAFLNRPYPIFPRGANGESALKFAHRYVPATTLGGDFFAFLQLSPTQCGILVCDVMGHGVRAGLLTALVRGVVEELGYRTGDPALVLAEINRSLLPIVERTGQPVFATVFYGMVDVVAGKLSYANAGHPPPLVRQAGSGNLLRLAPADPEPAAGLLGDFAYSRHECAFRTGDLLLGYTDGVLEAANDSGQMFGETGLAQMLSEAVADTTDALCNRLLKDVRAHSGRLVFEDDVCIVAVQAVNVG